MQAKNPSAIEEFLNIRVQDPQVINTGLQDPQVINIGVQDPQVINIGVQDPQVIRTSNAIIDYFINKQQTYEQEACQIMAYIGDSMDNKLTYTEMYLNSKDILGFKISEESFITSLFSLKRGLIAEQPDAVSYINTLFKDADDMNLFNDLGIPQGQWRQNLSAAIQNRSQNTTSSTVVENTPVNSDIRYNTEGLSSDSDKVSNTSSKSSKDSDTASNTSAEASTNSNAENNTDNDYHNISIPSDSDTSSTSSDTSFPGNIENNNGTILFYTLTAFVVINIIAWYIRTYHKDTLVKSSDVENNDNVLYSISEDLTLNDYCIKFILLFIPFSIVILYKFRYYYFFRLKAYCIKF